MSTPEPEGASPREDQPWERGAWSAPRTTPVSAVMASEVVCVRKELGVEALAALLLERSIGGVPVVDAEGKPVGVVSKTDLVRAEYEATGACAHAAGRTVAEIMTPVAFALHEGASLAQAAALMAYEGVHRIPIVSSAGRVVGLLTSLDVMRWMGQRSGYFVPGTTQIQRL